MINYRKVALLVYYSSPKSMKLIHLIDPLVQIVMFPDDNHFKSHFLVAQQTTPRLIFTLQTRTF